MVRVCLACVHALWAHACFCWFVPFLQTYKVLVYLQTRVLILVSACESVAEQSGQRQRGGACELAERSDWPDRVGLLQGAAVVWVGVQEDPDEAQ